MDKERYNTLRYNSKSRWMSYWYQISEALADSPQSVLLVGKGGGVTESVMRDLGPEGIRIVTLDIEQSLKPDVVASVTRLPFAENAFDVIICCQVLEHLSFDDFPACLEQMRRVCGKKVVLSLPHGRKALRIFLKIPFLGEKDIILNHPFTKKRILSKNHKWEICRLVSRTQVIEKISQLFHIEKEFLNEINCKHRFFILTGKQAPHGVPT